jgi:hypothetical protein
VLLEIRWINLSGSLPESSYPAITFLPTPYNIRIKNRNKSTLPCLLLVFQLPMSVKDNPMQ